MTLKEIIDRRGHKYDDDIIHQVSMSDYWKGYEMGWKCAYQDLREILDQYGFNKNIVVIKDGINVRQD